MKPKFSLKDRLFNREKVEYLAGLILDVFPEFNKSQFIEVVVDKFPELELKQRISWIRESLFEMLPDPYESAVEILVKSLPPENDPELEDNDFGDFIFAPYGEYVAVYGCTQDRLELSFKALHEITRRFSAEDAIRYFINAFEDETFEKLEQWCSDKNYHVRRLCSEGTRAKLPWCQSIKSSYNRPLVILDRLFSDKTRYVTRSVANHMNDISKIDPTLVISTLTRWEQSGRQSRSEMNFVIRHSLRTLIKQGHQGALKMMGYHDDPKIQIIRFELTSETLQLGDVLEFEVEIEASENEKLLIDYRIYFESSNSKERMKVFKLKQVELTSGKSFLFKKKHPLRADMSTFRIYPGKHAVVLQVNGRDYGLREFDIMPV